VDIIEFIEKTSGVKLKWYQKAYLKALLQEKTVVFPKRLGKQYYFDQIKKYYEIFTK
jgi:hypothetical protein